MRLAQPFHRPRRQPTLSEERLNEMAMGRKLCPIRSQPFRFQNRYLPDQRTSHTRFCTRRSLPVAIVFRTHDLVDHI